MAVKCDDERDAARHRNSHECASREVPDLTKVFHRGLSPVGPQLTKSKPLLPTKSKRAAFFCVGIIGAQLIVAKFELSASAK
jgi:hypothetical protein